MTEAAIEFLASPSQPSPKLGRQAGTKSQESQPEKVLKHIKAELPALLAVAAVEVATGRLLSAQQRSRAFGPGPAAHYAEAVRQQQLALQAQPGGRGRQRLADILVPLQRQLHLLRVARNGEWFVYLAVRADDTSLALAREVLRAATQRAGC